MRRLGQRLRLICIYTRTITPRTYIYIIHIFALCVFSLGVVPSALGVSSSGWGARVINGVATQSRPRAPSPLTQCAQGFSPSRACLSSRLVSSIYTHRKWPLPLHYIFCICGRTNEQASSRAALTHAHTYIYIFIIYKHMLLILRIKRRKTNKKIIKMIFQFTEL